MKNKPSILGVPLFLETPKWSSSAVYIPLSDGSSCCPGSDRRSLPPFGKGEGRVTPGAERGGGEIAFKRQLVGG